MKKALEMPTRTMDAASTSALLTKDQFITAAVVGGIGSVVAITNTGTGVANAFIANRSANAA